jgi:CHAT domain-containing protein
LHLACHAEPPSAGRAARLLLAPSVLQGDSGDLDDERIVAGLALQPGALVVMASCDSSKFGDAQRFINRGLVPAWLVVGASTVLGTLWPVADAAAREMLEAFYRHLLAGKRASEALRLAQSDAANGRYLNPALRDPRHWAGYQIHGLG